MDNGRIAEMGTYDELIAKNGLFAEVNRIQSEKDNDEIGD